MTTMMNSNKILTYDELIMFNDFSSRYNYARLSGIIGEDTFGSWRWLNQKFYTSREWKRLRQEIILRDNACDLAVPNYEIYGKIIVHHLNPITKEDVLNRSPKVFDKKFLICVSEETHRALHYGEELNIPKQEHIRYKNDTILW